MTHIACVLAPRFEAKVLRDASGALFQQAAMENSEGEDVKEGRFDRQSSNRRAGGRSRARDRLFVAAVLLLPGLTIFAGCSSTRPMAGYGLDLIENDGHSGVTRGFAGIGGILGSAVAVPFSILLLPSYAFEDAVVRSAAGYGAEEFPSQRRNIPPEETAAGGDIYIPWVLAPLEYFGGLGSALVGGPFEKIVSACCGTEAPPPPQGEVPERLEKRPGD